MDTTYWGRGFGVMLFKDSLTKENLLKYYIKTETNALYIQGIKELKSMGFRLVLSFAMAENVLSNRLKIFRFKCVSSINRQLSVDI